MTLVYIFLRHCLYFYQLFVVVRLLLRFIVRFGPRDEGFRCRKESVSIVGLYLPSMAVAMQVMYVVQNMSFWMNSLIWSHLSPPILLWSPPSPHSIFPQNIVFEKCLAWSIFTQLLIWGKFSIQNLVYIHEYVAVHSGGGLKKKMGTSFVSTFLHCHAFGIISLKTSLPSPQQNKTKQRICHFSSEELSPAES